MVAVLTGLAVTMTTKFPLEVVNVCSWPFVGAGPLRLMLPVALIGPVHVNGIIVTLARAFHPDVQLAAR